MAPFKARMPCMKAPEFIGWPSDLISVVKASAEVSIKAVSSPSLRPKSSPKSASILPNNASRALPAGTTTASDRRFDMSDKARSLDSSVPPTPGVVAAFIEPTMRSGRFHCLATPSPKSL